MTEEEVPLEKGPRWPKRQRQTVVPFETSFVPKERKAKAKKWRFEFEFAHTPCGKGILSQPKTTSTNSPRSGQASSSSPPSGAGKRQSLGVLTPRSAPLIKFHGRIRVRLVARRSTAIPGKIMITDKNDDTVLRDDVLPTPVSPESVLIEYDRAADVGHVVRRRSSRLPSPSLVQFEAYLPDTPESMDSTDGKSKPKARKSVNPRARMTAGKCPSTGNNVDSDGEEGESEMDQMYDDTKDDNGEDTQSVANNILQEAGHTNAEMKLNTMSPCTATVGSMSRLQIGSDAIGKEELPPCPKKSRRRSAFVPASAMLDDESDKSSEQGSSSTIPPGSASEIATSPHLPPPRKTRRSMRFVPLPTEDGETTENEERQQTQTESSQADTVPTVVSPPTTTATVITKRGGGRRRSVHIASNLLADVVVEEQKPEEALTTIAVKTQSMESTQSTVPVKGRRGRKSMFQLPNQPIQDQEVTTVTAQDTTQVAPKISTTEVLNPTELATVPNKDTETTVASKPRKGRRSVFLTREKTTDSDVTEEETVVPMDTVQVEVPTVPRRGRRSMGPTQWKRIVKPVEVGQTVAPPTVPNEEPTVSLNRRKGRRSVFPIELKKGVVDGEDTVVDIEVNLPAHLEDDTIPGTVIDIVDSLLANVVQMEEQEMSKDDAPMGVTPTRAPLDFSFVSTSPRPRVRKTAPLKEPFPLVLSPTSAESTPIQTKRGRGKRSMMFVGAYHMDMDSSDE